MLAVPNAVAEAQLIKHCKMGEKATRAHHAHARRHARARKDAYAHKDAQARPRTRDHARARMPTRTRTRLHSMTKMRQEVTSVWVEQLEEGRWGGLINEQEGGSQKGDVRTDQA